MEGNPFNLTFGREPIECISRPDYISKIEKDFKSDTMPNQIYMITGIRGSGKTVLLSQLTRIFSDDDSWVIVDLNSEREMLESFASQLYNNSKTKHLFLKAELNLSFSGVGFSIGKEKPSSDIEVIINKLVSYLDSKGKRILITIDDVTNNSYVKVFAHTFQALVRKNYGVFLLMTGLFENVRNLQNEKSLTFLYRAPQLFITPLSLISIAESFENILHVKEEDAIEMAKLTNGYAFAYQVLGYVLYESGKKKLDEEIIRLFDKYLREFVYEKVYHDLPNFEKKIVDIIALTDDGSISNIMKSLNINKENISQYRDKLLKKGILSASEWGKLSFVLPHFKEYVVIQKKFY